MSNYGILSGGKDFFPMSENQRIESFEFECETLNFLNQYAKVRLFHVKPSARRFVCRGVESRLR